ncbi:beta-defensin 107A-like [Oryx dammah]|uniref:beta-defensin 107A-like n=1 Tax=Oryx dammah TaxID=59534 RepID=UPI001A9AAB5E|nr:beta-defensin 107A-like [Oryx dammah]
MLVGLYVSFIFTGNNSGKWEVEDLILKIWSCRTCFNQFPSIKQLDSCHCVSFILSPLKPGAMKIFFFMFAAMILLGQIFSAPRSLQRQIRCLKMDGRCEVECLSFEDKIGGCRAELTPFCCRKRVN